MAQTPKGALKIAAARAGIDVNEYLAKKADGLKRCAACKQWKSLVFFNADRSRYDKLSSKCQGCTRVKIKVSTKGRVSNFLGKSHTEEAKDAMSRAATGRPSAKAGIPRSTETKLKISKTLRKTAKRGPEAPGWIDGLGTERRSMRSSDLAKRWRFDVMARDGWMCIHCGDAQGGNLQAHHRKQWATHPELRFDVDNGITLCVHCHWLAHAYDGCVPGLN